MLKCCIQRNHAMSLWPRQDASHTVGVSLQLCVYFFLLGFVSRGCILFVHSRPALPALCVMEGLRSCINNINKTTTDTQH